MMVALATLVELEDDDARSERSGGVSLQVDFNPQTLRLTHSATGPVATQGVAQSGGTGNTVTAGQDTGFTTELSLELLFDNTRDGSDVRDKTTQLVGLTRPVEGGATASKGRLVRISWGSFLFEGRIRTLGETIDLFSPDGIPLRATVAMTVTGVGRRDERPSSAAGLGAGAGISAGAGFSAGAGLAAGASVGASAGISAGAGASFGASAGAGASFGASASASVGASAGVSAGIGTTPLQLSTSGDTVQSIAAKAGVSWKAVAAANGIDNPRLLPPGTVIDVQVGAT